MLQPLAALLPIVLIVVLMVGARRSAAVAGLAGLAAALPVALLVFGWRGPEAAGGIAGALAGVAAEAGFTALTILWIVFPALWIHEFQLASGGTGTLRRGLARLSADPRIAVILVAWFFGLFSEGAAGFGTPVALAAPILVALGVAPARAVALALVGHATGVSFGAVGTPVLPQLAATDLAPAAVAGATATLNAAVSWVLALSLHRTATAEGGTAGPQWALLAAALFAVPFLAVAWTVGPELPTLAGALVGGGAYAWAVRRREGRSAGPSAQGASPRDLLAAALPYLMLLALILATRLIPPAKEALQGATLSWSLFGEFRGSVAPLYHPGTMLFLGLVIGGLLRGTETAVFRASAARAAARMPTVLLALAAMLGLARLMVHSGMIEALARGAAAALGPAWPLLAPTAGVLGSFVTGSATASNILLTDFQAATADALGLPLVAMMAAQGFGAAVGNIVCPHNIVAGAATVGLAGRETGEVLRRTLPVCAVAVALGGALVFAWVRLAA